VEKGRVSECMKEGEGMGFGVEIEKQQVWALWRAPRVWIPFLT